jgi:thiol-disulfide isomerase/thioredoxin
MKNFPISPLSIFFCMLTCCSPKTPNDAYLIKGKIQGKESGMLKLSYSVSDDSMVTDSAHIVNGNFEFKGKLNSPVMAYIMGESARGFDDPNVEGIFIEPSQMTLELTHNDFKNLRLKGSATQDDYQSLLESQKSFSGQLHELSKAQQTAGTDYYKAKEAGKSGRALSLLKEKEESIAKQLAPLQAERKQSELAFIKTHPDSYYSAYALKSLMSGMAMDKSIELYTKFTDRVRKSVYGAAVEKEIEYQKKGSPGNRAANFSAVDIDGKTLSLADFKAQKYVLLDFWASWCLPCRKGNPHLLSLYATYKDRGLEIIGIADDDNNPKIWKAAVKKDAIGVWRHILRGLRETETGFDRSKDISELFGVQSLPTKILIDKDGMIIGRYVDGENDASLDKKLTDIFKN